MSKREQTPFQHGNGVKYGLEVTECDSAGTKPSVKSLHCLKFGRETMPVVKIGTEQLKYGNSDIRSVLTFPGSIIPASVPRCGADFGLFAGEEGNVLRWRRQLCQNIAGS